MKPNLKILIIALIFIILMILLSRLLVNEKKIEKFTDNNQLIIKNNVFEILIHGIIKNNNLENIINDIIDKKKKNNNWNNESNIPKLIHFIWIGSKIPSKYIDNVLSYAKNNSNYTIYIWLDDNTLSQNIKDFSLMNNIELHNINEIILINKKGFELMENYGGKADILRYEIIYNYGGMYIDIDSKNKKPFDDNFNSPFVCIEIESYKNISNAHFGFSKNSPFLDFVITTLDKNIDYNLSNNGNLNDILSISGPPFFTTCFYYWHNEKINCINQYYVINNNPESYCYHTNDANWLKK